MDIYEWPPAMMRMVPVGWPPAYDADGAGGVATSYDADGAGGDCVRLLATIACRGDKQRCAMLQHSAATTSFVCAVSWGEGGVVCNKRIPKLQALENFLQVLENSKS